MPGLLYTAKWVSYWYDGLEDPWQLDLHWKGEYKGHKLSVISGDDEPEHSNQRSPWWELAVQSRGRWMILDRLYAEYVEEAFGFREPNLRAWVHAQVSRWAAEEQAYCDYYCP